MARKSLIELREEIRAVARGEREASPLSAPPPRSACTDPITLLNAGPTLPP